MLRRRWGLILAVVLAVLPRAPLPAGWRAAAAVAALLAAWPLALWPVGPPRLRVSRRSADEVLTTPRAGLALRLAWWPVAGALPLLLLTVLGLLGIPMSVLLPLWAAGLVVCALVGWRRTSSGADDSVERPNLFVTGALIATLFALVAFVFVRGAPLGAMDDAYDHLATIRHLTGASRLELPGAFYGVDMPRGMDPRKGVLHVGLALAARLAGVDALDVWRAAPPVLTALAGLAFCGLALALFGRWWLALLSLWGLLLFSGDPGRLVRSAYGGHWGLVVAWSGMAMALAGGGAAAGVLAGLAAAAVHAYAPAQLLVSLVAYRLLAPLFRHDPPAGLGGFIIGALAGALPVELVRLLISAHGGNPLHAQAMPWLMLPPGPVASPLEILKAWGLLGAGAALALLLGGTRRRDGAGIYLLGALMAPLALLLNPWLFAPVARHAGSVANKLLLCWEPALAVPALLALLDPSVARAARVPRPLVPVLLILLFVGGAGMARGRFEFLTTAPGPSLPVEISAAARLARRALPVGAIVASDPMTGYALPALTGHGTTLTLQQHAPPGDSRALERLAAVAALYSTCIPLDAALASIEREGATYLLLARQPPARIDQYGNHPDPRNEKELRDRFEGRPDLLMPVDSEAGAVLFKIVGSGARPQGSQGAPAPPAAVDLTGGQGGGARVLESGVELVVPEAPRGPWRRGEAVSLPATWLRRDPGAAYEELFAHIRFENADSPPVGGILAYISKPLRRLYLEPRAGGAFRARAVEMPFRGLCPVAAWPVGVVLDDTLRFTVPTGLLPGRYRLRVALERGTLYPLLKPADLLRDEDRFSGPVLGTLEIQ